MPFLKIAEHTRILTSPEGGTLGKRKVCLWRKVIGGEIRVAYTLGNPPKTNARGYKSTSRALQALAVDILVDGSFQRMYPSADYPSAEGGTNGND